MPAAEVVGAQRPQLAGGVQHAGVHGLAPRADEVPSRGEVGVDLGCGSVDFFASKEQFGVPH